MGEKLINYKEIQNRIDSGLITSRRHKYLPYEILNYTQRCQFDKFWDEYTMMCRGLILDDSHNIISRPFPKFFNLGETPETMIQNLPNEIPKITEKMDGSLGILYPDGNIPSIATRGSFESEQAIWATNWIKEKKYYMNDFEPNYTYLFEIICPESKNVVDYKDLQGLVLLAVISNKDGTELDAWEEAYRLNIWSPQSYQDKIEDMIDWLKTKSGIEKEGVVCKYSNGLRVKIKSDDYKRLHKILSGFGEKDIWEALSNGKSIDSMAEVVPDEFFQWLKDTESKLIKSYKEILADAKTVASEAAKLKSRREQATYILYESNNRPKGFSGLIFNVLDNKTEEATKSAWNILKP